jgi:enamine deaminase RidA (YjgF/YER057c/UK114 family)
VAENQPASTMVGVAALVMQELLIEVEATALMSE